MSEDVRIVYKPSLVSNEASLAHGKGDTVYVGVTVPSKLIVATRHGAPVAEDHQDFYMEHALYMRLSRIKRKRIRRRIIESVFFVD